MRILVIEDERKIANAIKKGLEQESFAVDVAYDSDEGYNTATADSYDLLIIDRMLPGSMEGLEICKKLRDEGFKMPVLVLTAKGQVNERIKGLDSGADDYMIKPFSFEELLARVRALLRRPQTVLGTSLVCGDLVLDTIAKTTQRANKTITLSRKEYGLLEYLMRNSGKVLSKDDIVSHVWNFDSNILPNTVEAFIKSLRKKIEKDFPNQDKLLHTVRGFGYKIQS